MPGGSGLPRAGSSGCQGQGRWRHEQLAVVAQRDANRADIHGRPLVMILLRRRLPLAALSLVLTVAGVIVVRLRRRHRGECQ